MLICTAAVFSVQLVSAPDMPVAQAAAAPQPVAAMAEAAGGGAPVAGSSLDEDLQVREERGPSWQLTAFAYKALVVGRLLLLVLLPCGRCARSASSAPCCCLLIAHNYVCLGCCRHAWTNCARRRSPSTVLQQCVLGVGAGRCVWVVVY